VLQVVRCFDDADITHVDGTVDPLRDIETIETELISPTSTPSSAASTRWLKQGKGGDKEALFHAQVAQRCSTP
jgi:ribosome-binding ATPase YchF (GTP1/OBG family)